MKIVAVICGNIRDIIDFKLTLNRLIELRAENKINHIIFSTWQGELNKHPILLEKMKIANIDIIETPTLQQHYTQIPTNSMNYWRQARQIQSALDAIEGECFILKARTDRCLNFLNQIDWKQNLFIPTKSFGAFKPVFKYKISVFSPKNVRLFNLNDFIFLGYKYDVYKMINFDISELLLDRDIVANTQWYIYPFFKEYSIIRDYFRLINYRPLVPALRDYVDNKLEKSEFPQFFYKVYAVYFGLLYINFNIMNYDVSLKKDIISKRYFYQIFTSTPSNEVLYTNIGSTIRSNDFISYFFTQQKQNDICKSDQSFFKYIAELSLHNSDLYLSETDYTELINFQRNKIYGEVKWLKKILNPPKISIQKTKPTTISIFDSDEGYLENLCRSQRFDKDLYQIWLERGNIMNAEKYLLPLAKSGMAYPILFLIRLVRHDLIKSKEIKNEILRLSQYFCEIKNVRNNFNFNFLLILINLNLIEVDSNQEKIKILLKKYFKLLVNYEVKEELNRLYLFKLSQLIVENNVSLPKENILQLQTIGLEINWNKDLYEYYKDKKYFDKTMCILNDRYSLINESVI